MAALTYTPKEMIAGTALTDTLVTLYTVPASTTGILKELELCNTDSVVHTVTVHVIAPSGTAGVLNSILYASTLQANESKYISLSRVMPTGTFIQAKADASSFVSINASGVLVT